MKDYALSVLLEKNEGSIRSMTHTLHVFSANSEDEAKGMAFEKALKVKKDFSVLSIIVHCLTE